MCQLSRANLQDPSNPAQIKMSGNILEQAWRWANPISQAWQRLREAFPRPARPPSTPTRGNPPDLESPHARATPADLSYPPRTINPTGRPAPASTAPTQAAREIAASSPMPNVVVEPLSTVQTINMASATTTVTPSASVVRNAPPSMPKILSDCAFGAPGAGDRWSARRDPTIAPERAPCARVCGRVARPGRLTASR